MQKNQITTNAAGATQPEIITGAAPTTPLHDLTPAQIAALDTWYRDTTASEGDTMRGIINASRAWEMPVGKWVALLTPQPDNASRPTRSGAVPAHPDL